jgi:hypothetical protein
MRAFRGFLHGLPASRASAVEARQTIEQRLRRVMARAERVASTADRDSMMDEPPIAVSVAPADLAQAAAVSNVARALDALEIVEYWKSAPYLLNFMRHYSLKRLLETQMDAPSAAIRDALLAARSAMLDRATLDTYAAGQSGLRAASDLAGRAGARERSASGGRRTAGWSAVRD